MYINYINVIVEFFRRARSSRSQMFFKIGALKNFHMKTSSGLQLY